MNPEDVGKSTKLKPLLFSSLAEDLEIKEEKLEKIMEQFRKKLEETTTKPTTIKIPSAGSISLSSFGVFKKTKKEEEIKEKLEGFILELLGETVSYMPKGLSIMIRCEVAKIVKKGSSMKLILTPIAGEGTVEVHTHEIEEIVEFENLLRSELE